LPDIPIIAPPKVLSKEDHRRMILAGEEDGIVVELKESGDVKTRGAYQQGRKVGRWRETSENGKGVVVGLYHEGKRNGVWVAFNPDLTPHSSEDRAGDELTGYDVRYMDGEPILIRTLQDGKWAGYFWMLPLKGVAGEPARIGQWGRHFGKDMPTNAQLTVSRPPNYVMNPLLDQIDRHEREVKKAQQLLKE
jgi:hypothetical protein